MKASERVGLYRPFRRVVDVLPTWSLLPLGFLATFGMPVLLAAAIEGRIWTLSVQYLGVWPGDAFLSLAFLFATIGVLMCTVPETGRWWQALWWHRTAMGIGLVFILVLKGAEIWATSTIPGKPGVYSWGQALAPTNLWHTLMVPLFAYLMLTFGAAALGSSEVPAWLKLLVVVCVIGWASCVTLDNFQVRPDVNLIYPSDGWWWQRPWFWQPLPR